ncbi:hypothetical protein ATANTOWER_008365 [Ataeniobius toweri]|uniref:Uncharacterized protein n=1 Tax=Ataeniobius toweri TaxID=208326 RepID=A0ABU7BXN9_9TELE|nr:hypothetical protein [Ataeniobius toweri]
METASEPAAEWIRPGITTARSNLSLFWFLLQTPLLTAAELPSPGATDLLHGTHKHSLNTPNIRFDVQLCPQQSLTNCPTDHCPVCANGPVQPFNHINSI